MKKLTRKKFLELFAATAVASGTSSAAFAQTTNLTTIAEDTDWPRAGSPLLFGATGLASSTRRLEHERLQEVRVFNVPRWGSYVRAFLFGGHVGQAIYRRASIELVLDRLARGYHFVELYLRDLYPYDFWDATPVEVDGQLMSGTAVRRFVPRLATLNLPKTTIRIVGTYGGQHLSGFDLLLPDYRAVQIP